MQQNIESAKRIIRTRWFRVTAILLILFLLFLVLLPRGISYGIKRWYTEQGVEQVTIEDVDFNPFTGNLVIHNMHVNRQNRVLGISELNARLDWIPLFSKRGFLQHIALNDADINIEQIKSGDLEVAGVAPQKSKEPEQVKAPEKPWGIGIESLVINNTTIHYTSPDLTSTFGIYSLQLTGLSSWAPEQPARLEFKGTINKGSITASGDVYPFRIAPGYKGTLTLSKLALNPFAAKASAVLSELSGILNINLKIDVSLDPRTGLAYKQQGNMELLDTRLATETHLATHERLAWNGKLTYTSKEGKPNIDMEADVVASKLGVKDSKTNIDLVGVNTLKLKDIRIQDLSSISIAGLAIDQLRLVQKQEASKADKPQLADTLLQVKTTNIGDLKLTNLRDIDIQSIELTELLARLQITKQGKLHLLGELTPATTEPAKEQVMEQPTETTKPVIRIGNTSILGNSQIHFQDNSVDPSFKQTLQLSKAMIQNLDNAKPDQPSELSVEGKLGKYSKITLNGNVQPFTKRLSLDLAGKIDAVELPPLSSYTAGKLGYNLMSGQMDADITLKIVQGKIDANSKLTINNLSVKPVDPEKMKKMTEQISVPLDTALNMLRDKENNINLTIPVKGDIEDPKFDASDAINQAIGNAMKGAAVGFLQHALQPYGALITIAKIAGKAANAVHLQPLVFTTGTAATESDPGQYLDKIASLLKSRPNLRIKLCGKATKDDRLYLHNQLAEELKKKAAKTKPKHTTDTRKSIKVPPITDNTLLDLAKKRAEMIKDLLINQKQINAKRLFICHPEVDKDTKGKPRVDLQI